MEEKAQNINEGKRNNTRLASVKALYAAQINEKINTKKSPAQLTVDIISFYFETEGKAKNLDQEFLVELIKGVCENQQILDDKIKSKLTDAWKLERLGPVLVGILRTATFEIMKYSDTHLKVIINEYVNITRSFFDEKEVGFVNGVLDKIGHEIRS